MLHAIRIADNEGGICTNNINECNCEQENGDNVKVITVYVHPKTSKWPAHANEEILNVTLDSMKRVIEISKSVITIIEFNCREVKWDLFVAGEGNT